MTTDERMKTEKIQYDINKEGIQISGFSSPES